ncbi:translesion error-prone DNA polymerase V autoproteolytic subunit [Candidatus Methylacidiphilum infernorum]|uniref:Translesion error-prone DNA polymerase V autoproteolytic subunit n=2 Tax=Candidatus Methylacidiphilum infernorum TaxID=511746 RepID=A0ABX7PXC9_9BACT|nr:translesion error-prone DNA polymerase V autoproteolytic subunit [Candidatus Methylacidiphilum infernorum]
MGMKEKPQGELANGSSPTPLPEGSEAKKEESFPGSFPYPGKVYRFNPQAEALSYPLFGCRVAAGFPNPADDHLEKSLSLDELLIKRPAATFFVKASGNSMEGEGIRDGDILVVDRAEKPKNGSIVVAAINGELVVKKLWMEAGHSWLKSVPAEGTKAFSMEIHEEVELVIWGVVTAVIHKF